MINGQTTPLIWPLLDRLNPTVAHQRRAAATNNRGFVRFPHAPWDNPLKRPVLGYGRYESDPHLWETAPLWFGLAALQVQPIRLQLLSTNPRFLPVTSMAQTRVTSPPMPWVSAGSAIIGSTIIRPGVVRAPKYPVRVSMINGITYDQNGSILGGCTVELYSTQDNRALARTVSDPVLGTFNFTAALYPPATHYLVAYLPGSPDVCGTTVNTLQGT